MAALSVQRLRGGTNRETLSSAATLPCQTGRQPRRASLQNKNLSLFDLLLDETYLWETLHEQSRLLAIEILARLIAKSLGNPDGEINHD